MLLCGNFRVRFVRFDIYDIRLQRCKLLLIMNRVLKVQELNFSKGHKNDQNFFA